MGLQGNVQAQPFELVVEYRTAKKDPIRVPLPDPLVIPRSGTDPETGEDIMFSRLYLRPKDDDASKAALRANYGYLNFTAFVNGTELTIDQLPKGRVSIATEDFLKEGTWTLLEASDLEGDYRFAAVRLLVRAGYSTTLLCAVEQSLRERKGATNSSVVDVLGGKRPNGGGGTQPTPQRRFLKDRSNKTLLYSFCPSDEDQVKLLETINSTGKLPEGLKDIRVTHDLRKIRADHKREVQRLLVSEVGGRSDISAGPLTLVPDVVSKEEYHVGIAKIAGSHFTFVEREIDETHEIHRMIDKESLVYLKGDDYCNFSLKDCKSLLANSEIRLTTNETMNGVTKAVHKALTIDNSGSGVMWQVLLDTKSYLDRELRLSLIYKLGPNMILLTTTSPFTVKNLGFVTTFPVVSEIAAAVADIDLKDQEALSSLSAAWAVRFSEGEDTSTDEIALMFPWIMSYNSRSAPDLSKYFALYPHLSLIITPGDEGKNAIQWTSGVGIQLAQAFQFAWGIALKSPHDNFILIGLNIPGLAALEL